jgi:Tol biopolymer transport system component
LIFDAKTNAFPDDWSHDGRYLIFELDGGVKMKSDLWLLPMTGELTPVPYLQTPFSETHARFSPDGRWVAYVSDESGRPEIYVQSFPATGGKWQVSTGGGDQPQWRGDGKELYYVAGDRNLMAVAVNTTSTFEASQPTALFQTRLPITTLTDDRNNYAGTADGQKFLVNNLVEQNNSAPITFVLNWDSGLSQ